MGRGSSKAGVSGGGALKSASNPNTKVPTSQAEEGIYNISKTMAFPSTASVVKRVPQLKELDQALKDAPEGTTISFNLGQRIGETWVYEKTGKSKWTASIVSGNTVRNGGSYSGIKLLQSVSDKKYNSLSEGMTSKELEIYKKKK